MKQDRLKELEKIADQLGIGQNREVECVSCHKKIQFKDAILLTNKETVSHLCKECNEKLINGELTKKQIEGDTILKQIEKLKEQEERNKKLVPHIPDGQRIIPMTPNQPWQRIDDNWRYPYQIEDVTYKTFTSSYIKPDNILLKFEPQRGTGE
jgi:RNase P subunit RPR2